MVRSALRGLSPGGRLREQAPDLRAVPDGRLARRQDVHGVMDARHRGQVNLFRVWIKVAHDFYNATRGPLGSTALTATAQDPAQVGVRGLVCTPGKETCGAGRRSP
jgi:hypothetical protein